MASVTEPIFRVVVGLEACPVTLYSIIPIVLASVLLASFFLRSRIHLSTASDRSHTRRICHALFHRTVLPYEALILIALSVPRFIWLYNALSLAVGRRSGAALSPFNIGHAFGLEMAIAEAVSHSLWKRRVWTPYWERKSRLLRQDIINDKEQAEAASSVECPTEDLEPVKHRLSLWRRFRSAFVPAKMEMSAIDVFINLQLKVTLNAFLMFTMIQLLPAMLCRPTSVWFDESISLWPSYVIVSAMHGVQTLRGLFLLRRFAETEMRFEKGGGWALAGCH